MYLLLLILLMTIGSLVYFYSTNIELLLISNSIDKKINESDSIWSIIHPASM